MMANNNTKNLKNIIKNPFPTIKRPKRTQITDSLAIHSYFRFMQPTCIDDPLNRIKSYDSNNYDPKEAKDSKHWGLSKPVFFSIFRHLKKRSKEEKLM